MPVFEKFSDMPGSADELYAYHARKGALRRLTPPFMRVRNVAEVEELKDGAVASLEIGVGPLWPRFIAEHLDVRPGHGFVDVMKDGPFKSWKHEHEFIDVGPGRVRLHDRITYELPMGVPGDSNVDRRLTRAFAHRHATAALDLALLRSFKHTRLVVGMTGASGLIGVELRALLEVAGHVVVPFVRRPPRADEAHWDPATGLVEWGGAPFDVVVHLAGEPVSAGRLNDDHARRVRESRVDATLRLIDVLSVRRVPPRAFVAASAVGFYGDRGDEELSEDAERGNGVLAEICEAWERAAASSAKHDMRWCSMRIGVALSPAGGALAKMLPAFRAGVGARLGDGKQWMPVVSIDDVAAIFFHAVVSDVMTGVVNAVGPEPMRNAVFTDLLARLLHRHALLTIPKVAARAVFGATADEAYLASDRALPTKLSAMGHPFRHSTVEGALRHLLGVV